MTVQIARFGSAVLLSVALAACSGTHAFVPSASPGSFGAGAGLATHGAARTMHPGDTASPGNGAGALPGNGAGALPGNGAGALPGSVLACTSAVSQGQADCTVAINVAVPSISSATTPAGLLPGLHPSDLQSLYALPSQNAGTTVAIVDAFDDPLAETELGVYRTAYGMPACTASNGCFRKVNQQGAAGTYPAPDPGWSEEIALDLDMVSAACPNCSILLVEANSANVDDLGAAVDRAVAMGARIVSNSYYAAEWSDEASEDVHYRHAGVAITVSSGDQPAAYYPAASPFVTAVGGTSVGGSTGAFTESPWQYGGNGCSRFEPRPRFQHGVPCTTRATVDVSAVADPQTGVSIFSSTAGGWVVAGGTSVGAPLVAAAYALAGSTPGPAYSYGRRTAFHDIAPAGYDLATGLGTPRGVGGF